MDRTERTIHRRGARHHRAPGHAHHPGPRLLVASSRRPVDHPARRPARQRPVHLHSREPSLDDARVAERGRVRRRVRRGRPRSHRARALRGDVARTPRDRAEGTPPASRSRRPRHRNARGGDRGVSHLGATCPDDHLRFRGTDTAARRAPPRQGWEGHMGPRTGVPGMEQLPLRIRDRTRLHRGRPDRGGHRRMAAHAGSRTARASAPVASGADRRDRGEHDQPQRADDPALRIGHADIGCAAITHRGVVLAELSRLAGAGLRGDAPQHGDADRIQPAHPRQGCLARARHHRAVPAIGAPHRALRRRVDPGVHRPACAGDTTNARRRRRRAPARTRARVQPPLLFRLTASTLLIAGLGGVYLAWLVPKMQLQPYSLAYAQEFPVCAAQWLAGAPEPLKVFNQYGEGGYLAYTLSPHGDKVFIFGDAALMGHPLLYTYAAVETATPSWDTFIRRAGTDIVLYDVNTPLADVMAHATDWTRVYQDGLSVAFVPTDKLQALHLPPVPHWAPGSICAQQAKAAPNAGAQNQ